MAVIVDVICRDDGVDDKGGDRGEQWTEVLSWEPRAFLYHNFLVCLTPLIVIYYKFS